MSFFSDWPEFQLPPPLKNIEILTRESFTRAKLHIFDLDDTLINTRETYIKQQTQALIDLFPSLLINHTVEHMSRELFLCSQKFGSSNSKAYFFEFLRNLDPPFAGSLAENANILAQHYEKFFWENIKPFPGAVDLLSLLTRAGKKVALASNGLYNRQIKKLKTANLITFFEESNILVSSLFHPDFKKPNPYMLKEIQMYMGVNLEDIIFYGNSPQDFEAGRKGGIKTAFYEKSTWLNNSQELSILPVAKIRCWREYVNFNLKN